MTFNTSALKEYTKKELLKVLDSVFVVNKVLGKKGLVIDPTITGALSVVAEYSLLKDHGVEKIYHLSDTIIEPEFHLIYLVRPLLQNVKWIADQLKSHQKKKSSVDHLIYFVPKRSLLCDTFLEEEGVYGDVTVGEFHLDIIPFEEDVISLDLSRSFREIFLEGDTTILQLLSNSLLKFQILYGFFPKLIGKGDHALLLAEMMDRSRIEYLTNTGTGLNDMKESEFDSCFIMDRNVDLLTVLKTQMTYEGLLDELQGIKSSFVELDSSFFAAKGTSSTSAKAKKILLNNTDHVFERIRDFPFELVGDILNGTAIEIKSEEDERHSLTTTTQLKEFASKLGVLQSRRQALDSHEKIYRRILQHASEPITKKKWQIEEQIIVKSVESSFLEYIEELIFGGRPIEEPLRLMCQYSIVFGGLKPKLFDQFRKDICEAYGSHHIFTIQNLVKLGILQVLYTKSSYSSISKSLKLVNDYDSDNIGDLSAVYRGYAPISLRLVQAASRTLPQTTDTKTTGISWKGFEDVLQLLPGKSFEKSIIPESKSFKTAKTNKVPITLVVFIGGCTFAEISALRILTRQEQSKRRYVVLATCILNGKTFLESLMETI